jgi:hypothetical protein
MENDLRLPFETKILGMTVIVEGSISPKTTSSSRCAGRIRPNSGSRSRNCHCPRPSRRGLSGSLRIDTGEPAYLMSTRVRKHASGRSKQRGSTGLRRDVQEAIGRVWPDGIVEILLIWMSHISPDFTRSSREPSAISEKRASFTSAKQTEGPGGGTSPIVKRTRRTKSSAHVLITHFSSARTAKSLHSKPKPKALQNPSS